MLDYLQLVSNTKRGNSTRDQEVGEVSRTLKAIAKDENIPILALSQLGRETEKRKNFKPQLSDLRESGSLEQDADVVMFIVRPEYYGTREDDHGNSTLGLAEITLAKNRDGSSNIVHRMRFRKELTKFEEYDEPEVLSSEDALQKRPVDLPPSDKPFDGF